MMPAQSYLGVSHDIRKALGLGESSTHVKQASVEEKPSIESQQNQI